MISNDLFPEHVITAAQRLFTHAIIEESKKFIQLARVNLSFSKGTPDTYFIVSGIVKQDRAHEAKVVYKKRLEQSPLGPLTSNCDCVFWSKESHCHHACALFLTFYLHLDNEKTFSENYSNNPPIPTNPFSGVNVYEYGTILKSPHELKGSNISQSYTSMQYLLHNSKIINFPAPQVFVGKLIIQLSSTSFLKETSQVADNISICRFGYLAPDDKEYFQVSIFENLYLFNWKIGETLHLSNKLKTFIQKVKILMPNISIDDYIRMIEESSIQNEIILKIDGVSLSEIPKEQSLIKVHLNKGNKRGQIQFDIIFNSETSNIIIPTPDFLNLFTFKGGYLNTFKKKNYAYKFIEQFYLFLQEADSRYKQELIVSSQRHKIDSILQHALNFKQSMHYNEENKMIFYYDNSVCIKIFESLYKSFGELFFRFSSYLEEEKILNYQVSSSTIFEGISSFYRQVNPYGVELFYNRQEIARWNSRIKFERNSSSTSWFDLKINISDIDMQLIKNAKLNSSIAFNGEHMIMLTEEQQTILKLLKKYTSVESKAKDKLKGERDHSFVLPFNRARIFELFELRKLGIDGLLTDKELELCNTLTNLTEIPKYKLPQSLKNILRPYQIISFNWLSFLYRHKLGACLADDMGLGKTLQVISFLIANIEEMEHVLIVCPVTILINWEKEFQKFSNLEVCVYHGDGRRIDSNKKIILTSYGVMKKEAETMFKDFLFDVMILDEVQYLKNLRSMGAFAARQIRSRFNICLTGTPVENDLSEFYNIIDLCMPGIWGDLQFIRTVSNKNSRLLARNMAKPFILRRTKKQVLTELPPKIENQILLELSEAEHASYQSSLKAIQYNIINTSKKQQYGAILKGLLELRQKCLWQLDNNAIHFPNENLNSIKIQFLIEQLEQIIEEGHQALVFSQFTKYLDQIQKIIQKKHWNMTRIDGTQSIKKRQSQVDIFQDGKSSVFLISLKAGGVGLNLTNASYVFLMDPWWNPAVENQAIDRAHRIGQKNSLTVYRPIIKNTVEEKVLKLQELKKELFQDLLPEDEHKLFSGKLTMNDFKTLLDS